MPSFFIFYSLFFSASPLSLRFFLSTVDFWNPKSFRRQDGVSASGFGGCGKRWFDLGKIGSDLDYGCSMVAGWGQGLEKRVSLECGCGRDENVVEARLDEGTSSNRNWGFD